MKTTKTTDNETLAIAAAVQYYCLLNLLHRRLEIERFVSSDRDPTTDYRYQNLAGWPVTFSPTELNPGHHFSS